MFNHLKMIRLSGAIWLLLGVFFFQFGISLLNQVMPEPVPFKMWTHPLLETIASFAGGRENGAMVLLAGCLMTGWIKGRFVFSRSARKGIERICSLPEPIPLWKLYSPGYYLMIALMIGMGTLVRQSGTPTDIRAAIYLSVGFAMMSASRYYFSYQPPQQVPKKVRARK